MILNPVSSDLEVTGGETHRGCPSILQRNVTGAELSISPSEAGSFKVTPPLSNPVKKKERQQAGGGREHRGQEE